MSPGFEIEVLGRMVARDGLELGDDVDRGDRKAPVEDRGECFLDDVLGGVFVAYAMRDEVDEACAVLAVQDLDGEAPPRALCVAGDEEHEGSQFRIHGSPSSRLAGNT
jgi:hypothetical protein